VRPRVAVVLSGGGARGIAQVGVLKALEENGIPIDFVAATSLGAVVGGLYASGYSPAELESLAVNTDWDEVLLLTGDTKRSDLVVEQKQESDRTFFSLRFEGFEPVLPAAVSSGQRLTDFLNFQVLQAVYHTDSTFDDLKIPFIAVSTDLISGDRVLLGDGSLAEALRASATVPLLFNPVEKDSLRLIDGGLVSNIPVDVAKDRGCDIVIAVNTTSSMRKEDELNAPWQAADQIMGIMMQFSNREQLELADVIIEPSLGRHLSSDFTGIDSLIREGERAADAVVARFRERYDKLAWGADSGAQFPGAELVIQGYWGMGSAWDSLRGRMDRGINGSVDLRKFLSDIYLTGEVEDAYAEVLQDESPVRIIVHVLSNATVRDVRFTGVTRIDGDAFLATSGAVTGKPYRPRVVIRMLEDLLRRYRDEGYSLARVTGVQFDDRSGVLSIAVSEGTIERIRIEGTERTEDYVVLREFPLQEGDLFELDRAREGVANIAGTTLFDYVNLGIEYNDKKPELTISLQERPSQLLSLGMRIDNERNLQGLAEIRDDNLGGTGSSVGLSISGGSRNQEYVLEFNVHRFFSSSVSFKTMAFLDVFDSFLYQDAVVSEPNTWRREHGGEYRDRRFGGSIALGMQIEKIGNTFLEYSLQTVNVSNKQGLDGLEERYDLSRLRLGTVVDSKNSYPFATSGVGMNLSFEFAFEGLGGDVRYNAVQASAETYVTWGRRHTLHPKGLVGFADKTMPFGEQFRLGGLEMMFGTREDDRRGRQLMLLNLEYRYFLPFQILFDTYLHLRYDLGTISEIPEQIKFSSFRHGVGAELSMDTPIGAGILGVGKSFFFEKRAPGSSVQHGPVLFYFMIGYPLYRP